MKTFKYSCIIIIGFLMYQYSKYLWAYYMIGPQAWNKLGAINRGTILLLTGITLSLACIRLLYGNFTLAAIGLRGPFLRQFLLAFGITLPMFVGFYFVQQEGIQADFVMLYKNMFLAGFGEEYMFRGFLFGLLFFKAGWGFIPANLVAAFFFGIGHLYQADNSTEAFAIFAFTGLASAGFAWFYYAFDSLWFVIFLHAFMDLSWNMYAIDTNVTGSTDINIFRGITLLLAIVWSVRIAKQKQRPDLIPYLWMHRSAC